MSIVAKAGMNEDVLEPPEPSSVDASPTREVPGTVEGVVDSNWLTKGADISVCGTTSTTAQVYVVFLDMCCNSDAYVHIRHPRLLTEALFAFAQEKGLRYIHGRPSAFRRRGPESTYPTLRISRGDDAELSLSCTELVLAAGPWTAQVAEELSIKPTPCISNRPGHRILIRADTPVSPLAVFANISKANSAESRRTLGGVMTESPELFPRLDGTVYAAGENHAQQMPRSASEVDGLVDEEMIGRLVRASAQIGLTLAKGRLETKQVRRVIHDGKSSISNCIHDSCVIAPPRRMDVRWLVRCVKAYG